MPAGLDPPNTEMGSFFFTPPAFPQEPPDIRDPQLPWSPGGATALPGAGTIGGFFGPIAGPVDIPPLFGPIAGGLPMPFDLGPNLTGLVGGVLGGLFAGRRRTQGFMPGQTTQTGVSFPGTGIPTTTFPARTTMAGQVTQKGCGCLIEKAMPAYTRKMKGRAMFGPDGSFLGCTPSRRSMNPMNARAATRAARRLRGVMRFNRRIEKAIKRACGSKTRGSTRFGSARKKTCK